MQQYESNSTPLMLAWRYRSICFELPLLA